MKHMKERRPAGSCQNSRRNRFGNERKCVPISVESRSEEWEEIPNETGALSEAAIFSSWEKLGAVGSNSAENSHEEVIEKAWPSPLVII